VKDKQVLYSDEQKRVNNVESCIVLVKSKSTINLQEAAYFRRTKLSCGPFLPLAYIREDLGEYKQLSLAFTVV
jgi:hypothetical protein